MKKNKNNSNMKYQIENGTCIIPVGTKAIEKEAFMNCTELRHVVIPDTVTEIGQSAFYGCSNLEDIHLPKSVTKIGPDAFAFCSSLTHIEVDEENKLFDSRDNSNAVIRKKNNTLLIGCSNTRIPQSVTNIGMSAFVGCTNLAHLDIPSSVNSIGSWAFFGCSQLEKLNMAHKVAMGLGVFEGTKKQLNEIDEKVLLQLKRA